MKTEIKCPSCSGPLNESRSDLAHIFECEQCNALWLHDGMFVNYIRSLTRSGSVLFRNPRLFKEDKDKHPAILCPLCKKKVKRLVYLYDSSPYLDKCEECGGMWIGTLQYDALKTLLRDRPRYIVMGKEIAKDKERSESFQEFGTLGRELSERINLFTMLCPKFIFPLSDSPPRMRFPIVTLLLVLANILIFVLMKIFVSDIWEFFMQYGYLPSDFISIKSITSAFLHASWLHLLGNMWFLWTFGDNVEDKMGRFKFIIYYLISAVVADLVHGFYYASASIPAVGASGAISAILGSYLIFYTDAKVNMFVINRVIAMPAYLYLGGWFAVQGLISIIVISGDPSAIGVAWLAHVGGFVFGCLVALLFKMLSSRRF